MNYAGTALGWCVCRRVSPRTAIHRINALPESGLCSGHIIDLGSYHRDGQAGAAKGEYPMRHILATMFLALPAHAGDTYAWGMLEGYRSTITLQPTDAPGAVAQVTFDNKTVHTDENVTFPLSLDGLTVEVYAQVGRGLTPDRMTVEAPPGFIAVPPELDVAEDDVGVILILPWLGF